MLTPKDRLGFRTLYYLGMATMAAHHSETAKWGVIGDIVENAEGEAGADLPAERAVIGKWIEDHQGHRQNIVPVKDIRDLRQVVLGMEPNNPGRTWRDAGLWLGHAEGSAMICLASKTDNWAPEIRNGFRLAKNDLEDVDKTHAQRLDPVAKLADAVRPDYRAIKDHISVFVDGIVWENPKRN